jgi:hypothetical protein
MSGELPGWTVTDQSGRAVQQADGPTAATLIGTSETTKGGGGDGSDRAGASEPDSESDAGH